MRLKILLVALVAAATMASSTPAVMLPANPGPPNNGGAEDWALFFDLEALGGALTVTELTTASTAAASAPFSVEIFTRTGSGLGGPVGSGPGSSPAGWISLGVAPATQGLVSGDVSLPIDIPDISIPGGGVVGVAMQFSGAGPRYFGSGSPPYGVYADGSLQLTTGDSRSEPFSTGGSFFSSRELVGSVTYVPEPAFATLIGLVSVGLMLVRRRS